GPFRARPYSAGNTATDAARSEVIRRDHPSSRQSGRRARPNRSPHPYHMGRINTLVRRIVRCTRVPGIEAARSVALEERLGHQVDHLEVAGNEVLEHDPLRP